MAGLYIHIPFCESRCIYCGFYSTTRTGLRRRYADALCREMEMRRGEMPGPPATIYLGGGTPSTLGGELLGRVFDYIYKVYGHCEGEITLECNPDDVTDDFCHALARLPVNRVSMGAQTFSNARLRFLHRRHSAAEVVTAVERLRRADIRNISLDLMFGFPGETPADWQTDIDNALQLHPEHLSAYSLMYEEGTPLHRMLIRGEVEEIDEDVSLHMYDMLIDRLTAAGYEHYEISNFALPGHRSRHNSSYWHGVPYVGLGASAHSYSGTARSWNVDNLQAYLEAIEAGRLPSESEKLDLTTRYNDLITTALRTREGIVLDAMHAEFGRALYGYMMQQAQNQLALGLLQTDGRSLSLTRKGLYVSDAVMVELIR